MGKIRNLLWHMKRCREFEKEHPVWILEGKKDLVSALALAATVGFVFASLTIRTIHIPTLLILLVTGCWLGKLEKEDPGDE